MNTLETLRHHAKLALSANRAGKFYLPHAIAKALRSKGFLDRWEAAEFLKCCPSALAGNAHSIFTVYSTGHVALFTAPKSQPVSIP